MRRRFILAVDGLPVEGRNQITQHLKALEPALSWWHWLADFWLIVDTRPEASCAGWRDAVRVMIPVSANCLVLELQGDDTWAVFAPKESHAWLFETWSRRR